MEIFPPDFALAPVANFALMRSLLIGSRLLLSYVVHMEEQQIGLNGLHTLLDSVSWYFACVRCIMTRTRQKGTKLQSFHILQSPRLLSYDIFSIKRIFTLWQRVETCTCGTSS